MLIYPHGDERRDELIAELYAVPFIKRPLWVFQQIEVVIWEGMPERWYHLASGRVIDRWKLRSGEVSNREHPASFWIPPVEDRRNVEPGDAVKLMFMMKDGWGERMWVDVEKRRGRKYVGSLVNTPIGIPRLGWGDVIKFRVEHIIDIDKDNGNDFPWPGPSAWQAPGVIDCDVIDTKARVQLTVCPLRGSGIRGRRRHRSEAASVSRTQRVPGGPAVRGGTRTSDQNCHGSDRPTGLQSMVV